jgi:hypothetical protein
MLAIDPACLVMDGFGFAVRHESASKRFYEIIVPYLIIRSRAFAPDLPDDLHKDVAHEVLLLLTRRIGKFDDSRGSFKTFINFLVRDAIKTVRASFTAPGFTTRPRKDSKEVAEETQATADGYQKAEAKLKPPEKPVEDFAAIIIDPIDMGELVEMRITVKDAFDAAEGLVADHWAELFIEEVPVINVAEMAGISRYKLTRQISAYRKMLFAA